MPADNGLDPVIHAPARLRVIVTLAALRDGDDLSFTRLQELNGLTPGNLITPAQARGRRLRDDRQVRQRRHLPHVGQPHPARPQCLGRLHGDLAAAGGSAGTNGTRAHQPGMASPG